MSIEQRGYDWEQFTPDDEAVLCFLRRTGSAGTAEVLLIEKKRGLGAGKVNGPGGKREGGETLQETAVRETEEEVGLKPVDPKHCGVLRFFFVDGYALEVHLFIARKWAGTLVETAEAIPFWVDEDRIPYDRMWEDDLYWLPKVLAGTAVEGEMVFDGDTMITWDLRYSDGTRRTGERDRLSV
ncbi:MAG: 8-oxo-dGTP diphosphatase [Alkalispirochaeta sp.]